MRNLILSLIISILCVGISYAGIDFDAVDDYVDATALSITNGDDVTISFWARPQTGSPAGNEGVGVFIGTLYGFGWSDNSDRWWIVKSGVGNFFGGLNNVTAGSWHHFLAVIEGSATTVYIDGSADGSAAVGHGGGTILIGKRSSSIQWFFGDITEVAIWNTALTATEISLLADSRMKRMPLTIQVSSLKAYWPFDDEEDGSSSDGDTFIDMSANAFNATGIDGANNTGLTAKAEEVLSYP